MTSFLQDFLPNVTATFVGVVLGLLADDIYEQRSDERKRRELEAALLERYVQAIRMNVEILKEIGSYSHKGGPTERVDTTRLDALSHRAADVLQDANLFLRLDEFRWQLGELNRRLDFHLELGTGPIRAVFAQQKDNFADSFARLESFLRDNWETRIAGLARRLLELAEALVRDIPAPKTDGAYARHGPTRPAAT